MPVGLEVIGESGAYQIIDNTPSLRFRTVVSYTTGNDAGVVARSITFSGSLSAICVIRSPVAYIHPIARTYNSSNETWTWTFLCYNTGGSTSVRFYVFDTVYPDVSGVGLQIFDDSGTIIYSSDRPPVNITGSYRLTGPNGNTSVTQTGTVTSLWGMLILSARVMVLPTTGSNVVRSYSRTGSSGPEFYSMLTSESAPQSSFGYAADHHVLNINLIGAS